MRLAEIRQRLADEVPQLKQVLLALSGTIAKSHPCAYVLPLAEGASPNEIWPAVEQMVNARFAVEITVKNVADAATGGAAQEELEDLRDAVKAALRGWAPDGYQPIDFASGKLIDFSAGMATWRDEFTTVFLERN